LLLSGIVDSTGVLEVIAHIEQRFGVTVDERDIVPTNFDSIANIARYVTKKQSVGQDRGPTLQSA
jgi:acyl carrier protein